MRNGESPRPEKTTARRGGVCTFSSIQNINTPPVQVFAGMLYAYVQLYYGPHHTKKRKRMRFRSLKYVNNSFSSPYPRNNPSIATLSSRNVLTTCTPST